MKSPAPAILAAAALHAAAAQPQLFPPVGELESALLMPKGASFEIGPDGGFLVDGKPRFLLGTIFYLAFSESSQLGPGPGYAPEHAWIYESPPTRDYLQRIGFDSAGGEVSTSWMHKYNPGKNFRRANRVIDWELTTNFWHSGLPVILDLTAATWSHGGLTFDKRRDPPERAFVDDPKGASHCISYSLVTEEGRDVWRTFWRTAAEELRDHGARPYAYELFNEPRYDDRSPGAREAFAAFLSEKFGGDPAAMDAAWGTSFGSFGAAAAFEKTGGCVGLGVEWLKFREAAFEGGVRLGVETIRAVDPEARVCFQPLARATDTDRVIGAEKYCQVVMTQTGGDDLWQNMRLLALADGKPLVDGETYFRNSRASHRGKLLRHFALGLNATYYFKWERRFTEIHPLNEEGLRRLFERYPWLGLNPYGTPPEAIAGLMDGKRDIAAVQDLFGPRDHGIPAAERVAVLSSLPTARLGEAAGLRCHAWSSETAVALVRGAHLATDAIHEEQLPEGRLDRYKVLVGAGIAATRPETLGIVRDWVGRGGTLLLAQEAMQLDEYARPAAEASGFPGISLGDELGGEPQALSFRGETVEAAPYRAAEFGDGWTVLASLPDGTPAIAERRVGKGRVVFVGVRLCNAGDQARLLASFAADAGIRPFCSVADAATGAPTDEIEVLAARGENGAAAFFVDNRGLAPRVVRFRSEVPVLADVSRRMVLGTDADGSAVLLLAPGVPVMLRGAPTRDALEAALASAPRAWNAGASAWSDKPEAEAAEAGSGDGRAPLADEPCEDVLARAPAWLAAHTTVSRASAKAFSVDPARVRFLDLREAATVPYHDDVADDGKGGWTDQGENCMENAPWGVTDCNGVPFDFIRPDQNGELAAVILRSTRQTYLPEAVRGIRADLRAEALWFLHAGAFLDPGKEAFRYVVRYADGTSLALPMRGYVEFDDWWMHGIVPGGRDAMLCKPGWLNAKSRGFHVLRWENPFPEKTITTIDIESANTKTAPIVEAISAETPRETPLAVLPLDGTPKLRAWGDARAESNSLDFASSRAFAGCSFTYPGSVEVPAGAGRADLEMILSTPDAHPLPPLQIRIGKTGGYVQLGSFLRETGVPGMWRVSFPLDLAADGLHAPFREFSLQLRGERPADTSTTVLVSDCRILAFGEPESPLALRRLMPQGHHGVGTVMRDGGLELTVSDKTESWGLARLTPVRPVVLPENAMSATLAFDVNGGRTPLGRRDQGRHRFRVSIECEVADGKKASGAWVRDPKTSDGPVDDDPNSWQTVRIPLANILPEGATALTRVNIQFTGLPDTGRAGLLVRDFRIADVSNQPAPSAVDRSTGATDKTEGVKQ